MSKRVCEKSVEAESRAKRRLQSYSIELKLEAVSYVKQGNSKESASRKFGVDPKRIREWCKQEERLLSMKSAHGSTTTEARKRLDGGGRKPLYKTLKTAVYKWIESSTFRNLATMSSEVNVHDVVDVYKTLSRYPDIKSAEISNKFTDEEIQVNSVWCQRDLDRNDKISFSKTYFLHNDSVHCSQPQEISKVERSVQSPSGQFVAVLRSVPQKQGEPKQYIEIWTENLRLHNISVDVLEKHGKIYDDNTFGCMAWSTAEDQLLYIAERKKPKTKSYFEQKGAVDDGKKDTSEGEEYIYEDDWGEQLTGKVHPVLCVLNIESESIVVFDILPPDVSAGPAVWCPDDLGIVCVGTYDGPFKLGRIYCPIRKSTLFYIDVKNSHCDMLMSDDMNVRSPVFSPDGSWLVFLENEAGGPHAQCSRLKVCDWSNKGITTVKDIVRDLTSADQFPGIFTETLPRRCWSKDSKRVILSTQWRSKRELVVIHCVKGDVTKLTDDPAVGSWSLLDVHDDLILASCASPNQPHQLMLAKLPPSGEEKDITWLKLDGVPSIPDVSWKINNISAPSDDSHKSFSSTDYEYIVIKPSSLSQDTPLPMIVFPHGGPHSVISADYMLYTTCLCRLGYLIVCVNYRGSYGFGQDSVESLPGSVGTSDVQDVQRAAEQVMMTHKVARDQVYVFGGSHGGFLAGHLIGQYPDFYRAAVMRNPVVNIASMVASTDIPDWTYVEVNMPYSERQDSLGTPDMYKKAWNMSPIRYVSQVKAAVLLCIGQNDRRVPNQQAHEYRKALMARGVPVKMLRYPEDSHPIIKVNSEADCFVNIVLWFRDHSGL